MKHNQRVLRALRSSRGLTLVEIMVVISILAVLMSIVAFNVVGVWEEAKVETTKLTILKTDGELQKYAATHRGELPSVEEGLAAATGGKETVDGWDRDLLYDRPSAHPDGHSFEVVSLGRDGAEGGEGYDKDLVNWELK